jgi:hypothetical protein
MNRNYKIIVITTGKPAQPYYCYDEFFKSLQGVEPLVLQAVQGVNWSGLGSKPKMLYKSIKDGLIKEKHILFSDCFDVVFQSHPDNVIDIWYEYNSPVVISSEKNCFPPDLRDEYDRLQTKSSHKYLNSGMIVGETEAILAALEAMDLKNVPEDYRREDGSMCHINDQQLWLELFLKQPVKMVLDYEQKLCNTLHSMTLEDLEFSERGIRNKETGYFPCSFHMNGNSKTAGLREPVLKHLNLL